MRARLFVTLDVYGFLVFVRVVKVDEGLGTKLESVQGSITGVGGGVVGFGGIGCGTVGVAIARWRGGQLWGQLVGGCRHSGRT